MERVMFLVEFSNEQISCLLNPESLLLQRRAGVSTRNIHGSVVTGSSLSDDPLLFTGGGTTLLTVNLLFDSNLSGIGGDVRHRDVRRMTVPLWMLTENHEQHEGRSRPASVRFIWGKAFNFLGIITDIAERLEHFTAEGIPQRSFLRLRMRRISEDTDDVPGGSMTALQMPDDLSTVVPNFADSTLTHAVNGAAAGGLEEIGDTERLDQLAYTYYGDSSLWRLLAWANNIIDPLRLGIGTVLQIPGQNAVQK